MRIQVYESSELLAEAAANRAAEILKEALGRKGEVNVIAATGNSQLQFLEKLARVPGVDWSRTVFFHLDEYVGVPETHPASFRKYLKEKVESKLHPKAFHYINGDKGDPEAECRRVGAIIKEREIEVAFVGVGENGHLAFNDPPADFDTRDPYLIVTLDEPCRRQQVNEGWFPKLEAVPKTAISMSIQQIMDARNILCIVPEERKAKAVRECFGNGVTNLHPASILQQHPGCTVFLDRGSASLLEKKP